MSKSHHSLRVLSVALAVVPDSEAWRLAFEYRL